MNWGSCLFLRSLKRNKIWFIIKRILIWTFFKKSVQKIHPNGPKYSSSWVVISKNDIRGSVSSISYKVLGLVLLQCWSLPQSIFHPWSMRQSTAQPLLKKKSHFLQIAYLEIDTLFCFSNAALCSVKNVLLNSYSSMKKKSKRFRRFFT